MKKLLEILILSLLWCNSVFALEINSTYACSQPDWMTEKLKIYNSYDNGNFVTYSISVMGGEYLDFGENYEGKIYGYNRSGRGLTVDEIGEEKDNIRTLIRYSFHSFHIEDLKSNFKSILGNVKDFKNFNLSDDQLSIEIQNYYFNKDYILGVAENDNEKFQEMLIGSDNYTCKKIKSENQKESKSDLYLKGTLIKQMEDGCLQGAKNDNNLTPKIQKYCKCYANWFDKNLNQNELIEFMNKTKNDQRAFIIRNNIAGYKSSICKL